MNESSILFKIGELSKKASISCRTIRYYEELGLICPMSLSEGGFRLYNYDVLHKLSVIKEFKDLGFSLDEIKAILLPAPQLNKTELLAHSRKVLNIQQNKIDLELNRLAELRNKNELALAMLDQCERCSEKSCPIDCINKKAHVK